MMMITAFSTVAGDHLYVPGDFFLHQQVDSVVSRVRNILADVYSKHEGTVLMEGLNGAPPARPDSQRL